MLRSSETNVKELQLTFTSTVTKQRTRIFQNRSRYFFLSCIYLSAIVTFEYANPSGLDSLNRVTIRWIYTESSAKTHAHMCTLFHAKHLSPAQRPAGQP